MKKIITLIITIAPFLSVAQKIKRHEIGIGIGYLQYTRGSYIPANSHSLKNSFIFSNKDKLNGGNINDFTNSKTSQSPVFYYSILIHKKIQIRASYQYTFEYTKTPPKIYYYDDFTDYYYPTYNSYYAEQITNDFSIGLTYSFINKKRYNIYSGIDYSLIYCKEYSSSYGYYIMQPSIKNNTFNTSYFEKKTGYTFNFPLGIKLNLSKSFNLKYEASFYYPDAFRPINRLSLNYQF